MNEQPLPKISLENKLHRKQEQILMLFAFNQTLIDIAKTKLNATWSATYKAWYLENTSSNLNRIKEAYKGVALFDASKFQKKLIIHKPTPVLNLEEKKEFLAYMKRKRYSENTIKIYSSFLNDFHVYIKGKPLENVTHTDIKNYIDHLISQKHVAISTQNQAINALKCYYENMCGWDKFSMALERPRKDKKLPKVLSKLEVLKIIQVCDNLKHKLIITLFYSSGLRMNELLNLRKTDVILEKNLIFVRTGKGGKDRTTMLADNLKKLLAVYLQYYKPNYWLFEGNNRKRYSASSVNKTIKKVTQKAGIKKVVTAHMFRHSFATHLLEQGVDIRYIQHLLGHESTKTTEIYTHVTSKHFAKIKSPLDTFLSSQLSDKEQLNISNNTININAPS